MFLVKEIHENNISLFFTNVYSNFIVIFLVKIFCSINGSRFPQCCLKCSSIFLYLIQQERREPAVEEILCNGIRRAIKVSELCKQAITEWAIVSSFCRHQSQSTQGSEWKGVCHCVKSALNDWWALLKSISH